MFRKQSFWKGSALLLASAMTAKLLGKGSRSEELYAISTVISGNNESQQLAFISDGNNICHATSL